MKSTKIETMINEQINKEFFSSYLYLAVADYYVEQNLDGFAHWFEIQAKEELDHAMLFRKYLINSDFPVNLEMILEPKTNFSKLNDSLLATLTHEQMITASINEIYYEALSFKDYRATQFLDWFIKEQGEEEKNSTDLLKKFELFGSDSKGLYLLNTELLTRVYAPPSLVL